jgi:hypothetical protein
MPTAPVQRVVYSAGSAGAAQASDGDGGFEIPAVYEFGSNSLALDGETISTWPTGVGSVGDVGQLDYADGSGGWDDANAPAVDPATGYFTTEIVASALLRAQGPVVEAAQGIDRMDFGVESGTPRQVYENSTANQIWETDVDGNGYMRFYPGPDSTLAMWLDPANSSVNPNLIFAGGYTPTGSEVFGILGNSVFNGAIGFGPDQAYQGSDGSGGINWIDALGAALNWNSNVGGLTFPSDIGITGNGGEISGFVTGAFDYLSVTSGGSISLNGAPIILDNSDTPASIQSASGTVAVTGTWPFAPLAGSPSITTVGTVTAGTWAATTLSPLHGGTGVGNATGSTITLGGPLTLSGAYATTLTTTGATSLTAPTSGTLATTSDAPSVAYSAMMFGAA